MIRRHRATVAALAALSCTLVALLAPALASASHKVFQVNSVGDLPKTAIGATCETATPGECTLRAAIEAADADTNTEPDLITFVRPEFVGDPLDEVILGSALPAISRSVMIVGNSCEVSGVVKPCAGVTAPTGDVALKVEADEVSIIDLALGGGSVGIEVAAGHTGFIAAGDWLGLSLGETSNGNSIADITLRAGVDGALIGQEGGTPEEEAGSRNVFTNSPVGVLVAGGSDDTIEGNYIGVAPNGGTLAGVDVGVRIVDFESSKAERNEVGGVLTGAQSSTAACDGACNVLATKEGGIGVDLAGVGGTTAAATGPTEILGNYLGLEASGTAAVPPSGPGKPDFGILAAPALGGCLSGPGNVTIGGAAPTESNYIEGDEYGVFAEASPNLSVAGNAFGINANGTVSAPPTEVAIHVCNKGVGRQAKITDNRVRLSPDPIGIESDWGHAEIVGNEIEGGLYGIATREESNNVGDLIKGNTVVGTDRQGIFVTNDSNVIVGNAVSGSQWSGIQIEEGGEHNRIGGDQAGEANTINEAGHSNPGAAITIAGEESSRNEVAANTGFGNEGAFIDLEGRSHSEIPNGLKPPVVTAALQSSATGTAVPGTKVRVFTKANAEAGELGGYLGSVTTDSLGVWKAAFATVPTGTLIAATQTSDAGMPTAGTSAVSAPLAAGADPAKPEEPKSGGGSSGSGSTSNPPPPPKAPKVKITAGPKKSSTATTAKFKFKAQPAAAAKFECKLDNAKWARCSSPKTYKKLKVGKHTFRVRATASGKTSAAVVFKFTVKE
ncbi:MAG: hypothetical protein JSS68_20850 [Actinobacteria bacterium]|nr:hypothetical protein [Actinomycetota bacterium]